MRIAVLTGLAAIALAPGPGRASPPRAASRPAPAAFACALEVGQARVDGPIGRLSFTLGPPSAPEVMLRAGEAGVAVFHRHDLGPRYYQTHLRFSRGPVSYVVYAYENLGEPRATGAGAVSERGVLVLKPGSEPVRRRCRSGPGFADVDLDAVPDDTEVDLSDYL